MAQTDTAEGVDTMSGSDALLWTISSDPVMRPTIVAVLVFASTPVWAEVRARVAALTEAVPRLRSTVVNRPPGRGRPRFVPDGAFDLDVHLRRMRLPDYGGLREVLDLAQTMATRGFDPALPLWEAVLVEGADPASGALVMKVHHSLIDGVGGLTVLAHLFDAPGGHALHPGWNRCQRRSADDRPCRGWGICLTRSGWSTTRWTPCSTPCARPAGWRHSARRSGGSWPRPAGRSLRS